MRFNLVPLILIDLWFLFLFIEIFVSESEFYLRERKFILFFRCYHGKYSRACLDRNFINSRSMENFIRSYHQLRVDETYDDRKGMVISLWKICLSHIEPTYPILEIHKIHFLRKNSSSFLISNWTIILEKLFSRVVVEAKFFIKLQVFFK